MAVLVYLLGTLVTLLCAVLLLRAYAQARTPLSDRISKDLLKRGFKFVGSTIVYAYLQAVGVVDDHFVDCPQRRVA